MIGASLAGSTGLITLSNLYGFAAPAAEFIVQHIDTLKQLDNALANRCGFVLEAATQGFGIGGEIGLLVIGLGQTILGNPLAGASVASAANPVVLTCAAIGAIHYGWNAMSDDVRSQVAQRVGHAFNVGVELILTLGRFTVDAIKAIMSRQNYDELKRFVRDAAASFGNRLSDVTHKLSDRIGEGAVPTKSFALRIVRWTPLERPTDQTS